MGGQHSPRLRLLRMLCDGEQREEFRQAEFRVADIMTSRPITVESSLLLADTIKLFSANRVRHILVTALGELIGVISDRDVLKALWKGREDLRQSVKDIATPHPRVAYPGTRVEEVASMMLMGHFSAIPVVDYDGRALGIVTSADLVWLLKLVQLANSKNPEQMRQHLVREIWRLVDTGELSEAEGGELKSVVGGGSAASSQPSPTA